MLDHQSVLFFILGAIVIILISVIYYFVNLNKNNHLNLKQLLLKTLFAIYIIGVISITILPIYIPDIFAPESRVLLFNIIPFHSISELILSAGEGGVYISIAFSNILGNLLIFVPLGFALPIIFKKINNLPKTLLIAFSISLLIEAIQFILTYLQLSSMRASDIDDVILNVLGALIGYVLFLIVCRRKEGKAQA